MGWLGKVIGGTLGLLLGGPLGAIAGAAIGHGIDVGSSRFTGPRRLSAAAGDYRQQAEMTFFVGTFSMLAKVAAADGRVSDEELRAVEGFIRNDLHLDPRSADFARRIFQAAVSSPEDFTDFARQFYNQFSRQPQILELLIDVLYRVGSADGILSSDEETMIRSGARIFNMHDSYVDTIKNRYSHSDESAYAVLGCSSADDNDTIKRAYKRLVMEHHPDRAASRGLPDDFIEYANKKFHEIQEAYDKIRRERGF